jgi:hypothetical protein
MNCIFLIKRLVYKDERSHQGKPGAHTNQSVSSEDRWISPLFTSNIVANVTFCVTVDERNDRDQKTNCHHASTEQTHIKSSHILQVTLSMNSAKSFV